MKSIRNSVVAGELIIGATEISASAAPTIVLSKNYKCLIKKISVGHVVYNSNDNAIINSAFQCYLDLQKIWSAVPDDTSLFLSRRVIFMPDKEENLNLIVPSGQILEFFIDARLWADDPTFDTIFDYSISIEFEETDNIE